MVHAKFSLQICLMSFKIRFIICKIHSTEKTVKSKTLLVRLTLIKKNSRDSNRDLSRIL